MNKSNYIKIFLAICLMFLSYCSENNTVEHNTAIRDYHTWLFVHYNELYTKYEKSSFLSVFCEIYKDFYSTSTVYGGKVSLDTFWLDFNLSGFYGTLYGINKKFEIEKFHPLCDRFLSFTILGDESNNIPRSLMLIYMPHCLEVYEPLPEQVIDNDFPLKIKWKPENNSSYIKISINYSNYQQGINLMFLFGGLTSDDGEFIYPINSIPSGSEVDISISRCLNDTLIVNSRIFILQSEVSQRYYFSIK